MTATATAERDQTNGRVPPHDIATEEALLGACFLSATACDVLVTTSPSDFYSPSHGTIAAAIISLHSAGEPVDTVTVAEHLARLGLLEHAGGGGRLTELQTNTPASTNAPKYASIVTEHARARRALHLAQELQEAVYRYDDHRVADTIVQLADHQAAGGVDELILEDMNAALDEDVDDLPTIFRRDGDGVCLLYPEAVNVIQSPPSIGKSWLALMAVHEVLVAGGTVLYLDYEDSPRRIVRRLLTLVPRLDRATIVTRFHYKRPGPLSPRGIAALPRLARRLNVDLVVIDGVADALALQGHDENDASDVLAWWTSIPRPLAHTGACVLLLDHVTKSKENRDRWARGSGAKLGAVDGAAYALDALEPLSRTRSSKLKLTIAKDRHGVVGAVGDIAALVTIQPENQGKTLAWQTDLPTTGTHAEWQGPTDCMTVIQKLFQENPDLGEVGKSAVPTHLKAIYSSSYRRETIYTALEKLVLEGVLVARSGSRNGRYYRLNPSRSDDLDTDATEMF